MRSTHRNCRASRHGLVISFALGLVLTMIMSSVDIHADSCPVTQSLTVTDAQEGFAGKTGTIWTVRPDCTFSVARFVGARIAEPHQQGRLTSDQQRRLAELLAKDPIAELPAKIGEATPVNPRSITLEYGGRVSVLAMGPGDRDVGMIQSVDPNDPRHRLLDFVFTLKDMVGG
jgi:hypothetical protein